MLLSAAMAGDDATLDFFGTDVSGAAMMVAQLDVKLFIAARRGELADAQQLRLAGGSVDEPMALAYAPQPIHGASRYGHLDMLRWRCDEGADLAACDSNGMQSVHFACSEGHVAVAEWIVAKAPTLLHARTTHRYPTDSSCLLEWSSPGGRALAREPGCRAAGCQLRWRPAAAPLACSQEHLEVVRYLV